MIDFLLAALPIGFLIFVMTKPRPLPSAKAFFLAAVLAYGIRAAYFQTPLNLLNASVILGLLSALTPISIVFGAIFFFVAMERSGAMDVLRGWLHDVSRNKVAQIMVVGWSFQFLLEGASGFGTPSALAAPILVGLGFPALPTAILCLVMNTIPVSFGAVGTPLWFGFGSLGLSYEQMTQIGLNVAVLQSLAALVIPVIALRFAVSWAEIRGNIGFIYLSILASVLPMLALATMNYEFPAVVGGLIGLLITILLARLGVGLKSEEPTSEGKTSKSFISRAVLLSLTPLVATVLILLATRIPFFGLRQLLTSATPNAAQSLGGLGEFTVSPALVLELHNILSEGLNWSHAVLYVPSIIPFVLTAGLALLLLRSPSGTSGKVLSETAGRIAGPTIALFGALVFVKLMMAGGENSSTMILGHSLAGATGGAWIYFAPFLGALGSFFSGSNTISNLTFGGIQYSIATDTGVAATTLLALQSAGGAMGNPICIHNIVAVCAVLGVVNKEGTILKVGLIPVLLYGIIFALAVLTIF